MNKQGKRLIALAAVLIFGWFNLATYWWVNSFGSVNAAIAQTWVAMTSNWMLLIILCDSAVFLVFIFVWLLNDARQREVTNGGMARGYSRLWQSGVNDLHIARSQKAT